MKEQIFTILSKYFGKKELAIIWIILNITVLLVIFFAPQGTRIFLQSWFSDFFKFIPKIILVILIIAIFFIGLTIYLFQRSIIKSLNATISELDSSKISKKVVRSNSTIDSVGDDRFQFQFNYPIDIDLFHNAKTIKSSIICKKCQIPLNIEYPDPLRTIYVCRSCDKTINLIDHDKIEAKTRSKFIKDFKSKNI